MGQTNFLSMNSVGGINQQVWYPQYQYFENLNSKIEFKFYEKFDNDIYDKVNSIMKMLDTTKDERNFVLQRLQTMCEQVFSNEGSEPGRSPKIL